ncbi:uncharacterized protein LOC118817420 isoform X2 [Colossoma macropomum]|uniref:uncharacterized protein LOC118817420 isoform X2 n=1 Tax=Colossoma macropomum TaxID=42526 RepID=UPI001863BD86|nr:uncharacterized protein LOC118817420 isoform X2 [Colossoma macropomum]
MTRDTVRAFVVICGKTLNSHKAFLHHLSHPSHFREVTSVDDSDVIIAFAPVVSRAGTDIEAALQKIQAISATQRVVLVVLHHTTERDPVVPNSSRSVNRSDVFTVDCLFNEDRGLLSCQHNDQALKAVKEHLGLVDSYTGDCCVSYFNPTKYPGETSPSPGQHLNSSRNDAPSVWLRLWLCLTQRPWKVLLWIFVSLSIILIYCLTTAEYIHAVWFIPWMLLLLVVLLERRGYGKWTPLIIIIVNMIVILLSLTVTKN